MFTTKPIAELPEHLQYLHGNRKQEYNDIADALNNGLYVELQPGEVSTPNLRFRLINAMQCRGLRIAVKQVGDKVLVIKK